MNTEALVRAVWAAGFRAGKTSGEDAATAHAWGTSSQLPQTPEEAWNVDVRWRVNTESNNYHLDIADPEAWEDVP